MFETYTARPKDFADLAPKDGGDQIRLLRFADGKAGDPLDVTGAGLDVWRPAVAVDGPARSSSPGPRRATATGTSIAGPIDPTRRRGRSAKRLTTGPGTDTDVVLATAPDGKVWMAWQSWSDGQADILLAPVEDAGTPLRVSETPANEWSPALAIDQGGRVHVAFDTYRRATTTSSSATRGRDGTLGPALAVARHAGYEARPSLAIDPTGRVWVAYEERTAHWGKDAENLIDGEGSSLYRRAPSGSAASTATACSSRPTRSPRPAEPDAIMNSFPRLASTARAGSGWPSGIARRWSGATTP